MSGAPELPLSAGGRHPTEVATEAAEAAATILKNHFRNLTGVEEKGKRNLVSRADLLAEEAVTDILGREYPGHSILTEECGTKDRAGEYRWILDPLDGTTNFVFGIPIFCVSIALACNDDVLVGVVFDPLRGEMFRAEKGKGAFLNGTSISVARGRGHETTVIGLDLGYDDERTRQMLRRVNEVWSPEISFRLLGSAALGVTSVACGRMDIYAHRRVYAWDIAAAMLLLTEAGGEITDWEGRPGSVWDESVVACGDPARHRELLNALRRPFDR